MTVDDLHDTERCPVGQLCESCGATGPRLVAVTGTTSRGVLCLTLCPRCGSSGSTPAMAASTTARLVAEHCGHLQIDGDTMSDVLEAGR